MTERCFNLFLFVADDIITEIGATAHELTGTDDAKLRHLQDAVGADFPTSRRFPPPSCVVMRNGRPARSGLSWAGYVHLQAVGQSMRFLEPVFAAIKAPREPLFVLTCIVDGKPRIDAHIDHSPEAAAWALAQRAKP